MDSVPERDVMRVDRRPHRNRRRSEGSLDAGVARETRWAVVSAAAQPQSPQSEPFLVWLLAHRRVPLGFVAAIAAYWFAAPTLAVDRRRLPRRAPGSRRFASGAPAICRRRARSRRPGRTGSCDIRSTSGRRSWASDSRSRRARGCPPPSCSSILRSRFPRRPDVRRSRSTRTSAAPTQRIARVAAASGRGRSAGRRCTPITNRDRSSALRIAIGLLVVRMRI